MVLQPKLIIIGGAPATGKTKFAERICASTGFSHVSKDLIKEHLFDVLGYRDREWSRDLGRLVFPLFMGVIEMYLKRGESVVVDNPFVALEDLEWFERFEREYHAEIIQIHLTADPIILRERFIARANSDERHPGHNDSLHEVMEEFDQKWFDRTFIPLPIKAKTKIVDTTDFSEVDHDEILRWVE